MELPPIIDIAGKLAAIDAYWRPRIVGHYNGNEIRLSKVKGEFPWHAHEDTDEMFLVIAGELTVEFRDGAQLKPGELIVVPRGVEHRTRATDECHMLFLDRAGEPNTGGRTVAGVTLDALERD